MNPKLRKLIEDVAKINVEAARFIELEAPKLKSYKIWEVPRLSNLFDWAESPQLPGYWFDIDEKVFMLAKGQPKEEGIDFKPDASLNEYYRKAKFFNTEDFVAEDGPCESSEADEMTELLSPVVFLRDVLDILSDGDNMDPEKLLGDTVILINDYLKSHDKKEKITRLMETMK